MNNMKYYPFDRNSYYSGKVWSAGDFESEQRYMNDKRRLQNRFVNGMGIVCGLDVVSLDSGRISIEKGIAFDGCGREIVLTEPKIKKLSAIEGYESRRNNIVYYLYLSYMENSETGEKTETSRHASDKIREEGVFYLSENRPVLDAGDIHYFYYNLVTLFENEYVRIESILPKYIRAGRKFMYRLRIDTGQSDDRIILSMRLKLECVRYQGKDRIDVVFDSMKQKGKNGVYELEFICDSMNIVEDLAGFTIMPEDFQLDAGERHFSLSQPQKIDAVMTDVPVEECVINDYKTCLMNYIERNPVIDICIAMITVADGKILSIDNRARIYNVYANESLALTQNIIRERIHILEKQKNSMTPVLYDQGHPDADYEISTGEVVISMGIGGDAGKVFYSEEITHGLGLGNVAIILGLKDQSDRDGSFIYGSSEVFEKKGKILKAELAAKVDPVRGTFVIGARLMDFSSAYEMVIHWTAIKRKDRDHYGKERKIIIDNSLKSLRVMESDYFSVKFINMEKTDIKWSVEGRNAGSINESGCYTAPDHPGVFQIRAQCIKEPQIQASAFIVVKP